MTAKQSFRGDAKHRTQNLEIPGLVLKHHPGMTAPHPITSATRPIALRSIRSRIALA